MRLIRPTLPIPIHGHAYLSPKGEARSASRDFRATARVDWYPDPPERFREAEWWRAGVYGRGAIIEEIVLEPDRVTAGGHHGFAVELEESPDAPEIEPKPDGKNHRTLAEFTLPATTAHSAFSQRLTIGKDGRRDDTLRAETTDASLLIPAEVKEEFIVVANPPVPPVPPLPGHAHFRIVATENDGRPQVWLEAEYRDESPTYASHEPWELKTALLLAEGPAIIRLE